MLRKPILRYLNPWKFRREEKAARLRALRARDGDDCARCRRPISFDLPDGHDQGATIEPIAFGAVGELQALDELRLCHRRCNTPGRDHTGEVTERIRRKNEAELFGSSRRRQKKAA
jgi:5-methylcytosine-specific restriction endonuclease McrA